MTSVVTTDISTNWIVHWSLQLKLSHHLITPLIAIVIYNTLERCAKVHKRGTYQFFMFYQIQTVQYISKFTTGHWIMSLVLDLKPSGLGPTAQTTGVLSIHLLLLIFLLQQGGWFEKAKCLFFKNTSSLFVTVMQHLSICSQSRNLASLYLKTGPKLVQSVLRISGGPRKEMPVKYLFIKLINKTIAKQVKLCVEFTGDVVFRSAMNT